MQQSVTNFQERDVILEPLTVEELSDLARRAGGVESLLSKKSPKYREYQHRVVKAEDWLPLMAEEPRLLRRPILALDQKLWIGFDPDAWQEALSRQH